MQLVYFSVVILAALIARFSAVYDSEKTMIEEIKKNLQKHERISRMICGMEVLTGKELAVYNEFALYECDRDNPLSSGRMRFRECFFGERHEVDRRLINRTEAENNMHYCRQFASQVLYSDEPDDHLHIWDHERFMCDHQKRRSDVLFYSFYNHKLVSCKDGKYQFEACIFDTGIVLADSNIAAQANMSTNHKDICYKIAHRMGVPLDEIFFTKDPYSGISALENGLYNLKETVKSRRLYSENNIQKFHKSVLCDTLEMRIVFYEFGLFQCKNNELVLIDCLYGNITVNATTVQNILFKQSGDYIDDTKDLRFCGQLSHFYLESGRSHDQKNMWLHEEFVCYLMKQSQQFSKSSEYSGHGLTHQFSKWHEYNIRMGKEKSSGYAVYHNFQIKQCDSINQQTFLLGCLFDTKYYPLENAVNELKNYGLDINEDHRDFCFELGRNSMLIKNSSITRRLKHLEAGLRVDCTVSKWPNYTIPFYIDSSVRNLHNLVQAAMHEIEKYTCLKFTQIFLEDSVKNYVHIKSDFGSENFLKCISSNLGMNSEKQSIYIGSNCNIFKPLGHVIGVVGDLHQPNRDKWLSLNFTNFLLNKDWKHQIFRYKYNSCSNHPAYQDDIYDSMSAFNIDSKLSRAEGVVENFRFGTQQLNEHLSYCDVARINRLYECDSRKYLTDCYGLTGSIKPLVNKIQNTKLFEK